MAKRTSGQKYNFLVGLMRQLEDASDEGDEAYADWRRRLEEDVDITGFAELEGRIAKLEQWLAQLESAMAELEQECGESVGEDALDDDDGDYDDDVEGMAVQMVSPRPPMRRDARPVERAATQDRPVNGEVISVKQKRRVTRGTE